MGTSGLLSSVQRSAAIFFRAAILHTHLTYKNITGFFSNLFVSHVVYIHSFPQSFTAYISTHYPINSIKSLKGNSFIIAESHTIIE